MPSADVLARALLPREAGYQYGNVLPYRGVAGADGKIVKGTAELAVPGLLRDAVNSAYDAVTLPGDVATGARQATPENALNLAGALTLGAGAVPAEAGALRAGVGLTKKAQLADLLSRWQPTSKRPVVIQAYEKGLPIGGAEQMAVAHPSAFGSYTGVKPAIPEGDFAAQYQMLPGMEGPRQVFDPASLEHAHVIPMIADRSIAGGRLTELNGVPLDVALHGGPRYAEANALQGSAAAWANQPAPAGALRNQIREGLEKGKRVIGLTVNMGPTTADQSTMMSDVMLQRLRLADLLKKDVKGIDQEARQIMPGFPGVHHPEAMDFLLGQRQPDRKQWIEALETNPRVAQGVPDVNQARLALTEPGLRDVPAGAAGFSAMEFGPESLLPHTPTLEHPTYNSQIPGTPLGGLEQLLPYHVIAPGMYGLRREAGAPIGSDFKSMERARWGGSISPQVFDEAMQYLEKVRQ